ncbi:hypothetical protein ZWY2020_016001 [Hordeum vulgare]|nr:hypothetical protein ZWY2020_016001 [Hordeum vulgare]
MGRSKSTLEESEVADLLAMKGEFMQHREETADMRGEVDDLRKDVHNINLKQDTMVSVLDGVQKAVSTLSSQLSTMADVLKSLRSTEASSSAQQGKSSPDLPQKETATMDRAMFEEIRRRVVLEQEKSRLAAAQIPTHLPPIQVPRPAIPPGFGTSQPVEIHSGNAIPTAAYKTARTPGFHGFQPPGVRQSWDDFHKHYDQEMRTQFLKSITKGPCMDFPALMEITQ